MSPAMSAAEFALWKMEAENSMAHLHFEINQLTHRLAQLAIAVKKIDDFAPFDPTCGVPEGYWSAVNALPEALKKSAE
jgi:hypothetical protein